MTEELGAVGVALRVNLGRLDQDLAAIEKKIKPIAKEHKISFAVGGVNVAAAQEEIRRITRGKLTVQVAVGLPANAGRLLHRELTSQMKAAGPVPVQVKANLSRTEILRIKREIEVAMRRTGAPISVPIRTTGGGGSATGGAAPAAAPQRATAPRSAPVTPQAASAPAATAPARGRAASKGKTAREAHEDVAAQAAPAPAPKPPRSRAKPIAAAPGVPLADPDDDVAPLDAAGIARIKAARARQAAGYPRLPLPTGPSSGVTYRTDAKGNVTTVRGKTSGVTRILQKKADRLAGQTVSLNTLRDEKIHTNTPETPEELEYADRVGHYAPAGKSRGLRGASRSGARQHNEPETRIDPLGAAIQRIRADEHSGERSAELTGPVRATPAFYGGRHTEHAGYNRQVDALQFKSLDPRMKQAYEALVAGDPDAARAHLRGVSADLVTANPRQRKKYFRVLGNIERGDAQLGTAQSGIAALFKEIGIAAHDKRVAATEAELADFPKPKGPKSSWPEEVASAHTALQDAAKDARKRARDFLSGISRRAGGGPVQGGGLMARLEAARAAKNAYLVADGHKDELFVGESGKMEVLKQPAHVRTFDEPGKIEPHVPEWIRRGMAKDLTHRQAGGPIYSGRLAAEPGSGLRGRKVYREGFDGERAAIAAGNLSSQGGVQRVFVVNWPATAGIVGGIVSNPRGLGVAASNRAGTRETTDLARAIGVTLKDLLGLPKAEAKDSQPETSKPPKLTPEQQVQSRLESITGASPRELQAQLTSIRSGLSETQSQSPVRSLAPAFGQIVATQFGRGELLKRLATARELTERASRAEGVYKGELKKELDIQASLNKATDPKQRKELTEQLEEQTKATSAALTETKGLVSEAEVAAKKADALSLKLGTLIGNTVGIVGGTLAFGATLGIAQAGLSAVSEVMAPVIERMTGFTGTSAKVTAALDEQIKAQSGAADTAFAMIAAQAGLANSTANTIGPLVTQRATIEEGNKQLLAGLELLHTYEEAQRKGGDQGLRGTTNGAFGSILGGTPSTQEIIKNELGGADATSRPDLTPQRVNELKAERDALLKEQAAAPRGFIGLPKQNRLAQIQSDLSTADKSGVLEGRVKAFNDALEKGGSKLKFVAGVSDDVATAFANVANKAQFTELGQLATGPNRVILVDENNAPVKSGADIEKALGSLTKAQTETDTQLLLKQLTERIIPAQKNKFAAEGQLQRQLNPAQFALQEIASPTPGLKGGPAFSAGTVGIDSLTGKSDQAAAKAAKSYETQVGGAVSYVNEQIAKGRDTLINLVPANLQGEFRQLLGDIEKTGTQISNIQLGIQQKQVNLQVAEYNNQLRIARRSLQDAKDLQAGLSGEARNTLGGIEGQNIAIQRQLQLLQFELQQRQINFKLATAGFVAPGTTPEERAARIDAAKQEAAFAQKQLDLQKQLSANEFKGVQITVDRNVTDLLAQISLLEQGRSVTIDVAAASRALDILNKKQQLMLQQAGTYIEEGVKITQAAIDAATEVQRQTGKGFSIILSQTANAWGIFGDQAKRMLDALTGTAIVRRDGSQPGQNDPKLASGIVGDTLGPTQITVGEAAGEKVAVLKNPKIVPSWSLSGQGGGSGSSSAPAVNITVIVSGNSLGSNVDAEELGNRIAAKVEDRLMQKGALFGLRRA